MGIHERRFSREAHFSGATIRKKAKVLTEAMEVDGDASAPPHMEQSQRHHGAKRLPGYNKHYTEVPYCDGFQWRKYGEKGISGLPFTRCYYKCTNNPCPAKKRVEQHNKDDPPMYLVTYENEHTCNAAPSTAHHQVPMSHASPNSPFLLNSVCSPNLQTGQPEQFQFNPSFNTEVMALGFMEIEARAPECAAPWWNLPTSPLSIDQMGICTFEDIFDELNDLPPTLSFTAHGSHGEASALDQGNIADSWFSLPATTDIISMRSLLEEIYPLGYAFDEPERFPPTLSFTAEAGHGEADALDQRNVVIPSSDQSAAPGLMMPTGLMETGNHDSIFTFEGILDAPNDTAHGSHGETSAPDQGDIADSWLNLPDAPDFILLGSLLEESYPLEHAFDEPEQFPPTLSVTAQGGHGDAGAMDQSDVVIPSSDQSAAPGLMMPTAPIDSSLEFAVDYSWMMEPWELPDFDIMNWLR